MSGDDDRYRIDPAKLPKQLDLDLSPAVAEHLRKVAAQTGRSVEELILEIINRYLHES